MTLNDLWAVLISVAVLTITGTMVYRVLLRRERPKRQSELNDHKEGNIYHDMRARALSVTPEQIGLSASDSSVYGVVMDWRLAKGVCSLVCYRTGDASLYTSTGGGVLGGIQHESVREAAQNLILLSNRYTNKATKTNSTPLPEIDEVRFYFLTSGGLLTPKDSNLNFSNYPPEWIELFDQCNVVIGALRVATDRRQK